MPAHPWIPDELDQNTGSKARLIRTVMERLPIKGYEGLGLQEILENAQVAKSNFYYHFPSKETLCLVALEHLIAGYEAHLLAPTIHNRALGPKKRLKALFYTLENEGSPPPGCPFAKLLHEINETNHPALHSRLLQFFTHYAKTLEDCYQEGVASRQFRKDIPPQAASQILLSVILGGTSTEKALGLKGDSLPFGQNVLTLLCDTP
jgi:TetR/AcrR family transcriptional repressor of nem operon